MIPYVVSLDDIDCISKMFQNYYYTEDFWYQKLSRKNVVSINTGMSITFELMSDLKFKKIREINSTWKKREK